MSNTYIYAIGSIKMQFPSPGIEKEFAQTVAESGQTRNVSDRQVQYETLKAHRHLANEVCWVFSVESVDAYILVARDSQMLDEFIEAVKPTERSLDIDVIIGTRGPMAPPEACNGLVVPLVIVDRLYSFNKPDLMAALEKPPGSGMSDEAFRDVAESLFERIQLLADNVGATDEHRALNYLAVRYRQIYHHTNNMNEGGFTLSGVEVIPSRLGVTRRLVDVIFSYTNRNTDVVEKYYVRVDVTEKYPFLDKKLSPYYDR